MSYGIHLAFWSNIWDRIFHISQALNHLIKEGIIFDCISSSYYRSEPIDAGWLFYINTVVRAKTDLSANDLLIAVLNIENRCGRIRYWYHNSRTIDIDILLYWDEVYFSDILTIPHPRIQERAFVMCPLLEIDPNIYIPWIWDLKDITIPANQSIEKLNSRNISWKGKRAIMWILNITPDSFFDGWNYIQADLAIQQVERLISEWADIIDIGWQSTRPGHEKISPGEEIRRLEPIVSRIREIYPDFPISIDTYFPEVIKYLSKYTIDIINNVDGWDINENMMSAISKSWASYVLTSNDSNIEEMIWHFTKNIDLLHKKGITDIIIDPWFWFGKELNENYQILAKIESLQKLNAPILVGVSRKSMIYKSLNITPHGALNGTTAIHMLALMNGAHILRVHDVKEAKEALNLFEIYERNIR